VSEYTIRPTFVKKQPSTDYIAILHPSDMKKIKVGDNAYINLKKIVSNGKETKELQVLAQVISSEHKLSKMTSSDAKALKPGEVGVDQTLRESLGLVVGEKVILSKTNRKYGITDKLLTRLDYQKAIVRVQANAPYMEHKIPVVCLCEEIVSSIGANYGDRIVVESNNNKIIAKCAKPISSMKEFHDFVLDLSNVSKVKAKLTEGYFLDPSDFGIKSERLKQGEMTHPIFMDAIAMHLLGVERLYPVKIRKFLWWEVQKKLNSFGSVSLIAFSVTLSFLVQDPSSIILWIWSITLGAWGGWSVLTSSTYRTSNESD
jgi:hypothetical protein